MFYWVIPYLVAFNLTDSAADWKNGPVYIFKADATARIINDTEVTCYSQTTILFECRPMDMSFLKCRVQNSTLKNYHMAYNNDTCVGQENPLFYKEFENMDFHIEFDRTGIKDITFPEPQGYFREMLILSILTNLNVGIDLTDKNSDRYDATEKSIYGECPTNFGIEIMNERAEYKEPVLSGDPAIGRLIIVPFLDKLASDEMIVIEKERQMSECLDKKFYRFGSDTPPPTNSKKRLKGNHEIVRSRAKMSLGRSHFNTFNEHSGNFRMQLEPEHRFYRTLGMMTGLISDHISLDLLSILKDKAQDSHVF